ncbi:hypothetical protein Drorol1_Dr00022456 [Drosera rotundifolia]
MASSSSSPVTPIPMLAIHEKKTLAVDLYRPLRNHIALHYSEREAQSLEDDLQTLKLLRSDLSKSPSLDPLSSRRDLLIRYLKALTLIETRFPISPDKDHINNVQFTWFDAFKVKSKASQVSIGIEKAAVVFNLGAVWSQIGVGVERGTVEGRREAVRCFAAAAGAFAMLREGLAAKAVAGGAVTVDLGVECVGMLERLMLAQAQECVFENTIAKGSTPGVCAKISKQVGIYYEETLVALNAAPLNQHFEKGWITHVQLKAALFNAEACYRYSLELHDKEEIAEEIVRLRIGLNTINEARKSFKGAPAQLLDAVSKLEANLNRNLERAMKENDRVYLQRIPPASSLTPVPAFSMVKPTPLNEALDASKEKLFATLIPDNSAKALSRYTEMVDEVIRTQAEKLQQGSELARVRLKEMDLPDSILALDGNVTLPEDIKDDVEAVQISGGPAGLEAELQQLKDLRRVNQEMLVQTEEILQKEAQEDAQFRSQFGTRWTRPHSSTLTKTLQDRLNRFAGNLKQAGESDAKIERSVREYSSLMAILDRHPIEAALPSLAKPIMSLDANEDAIVGALKQSLVILRSSFCCQLRILGRQLENLGTQRAGLEDMLKEMKRKDDILPKLMTCTGSYEDLFKKEIAKYDNICGEITQNLEAQEYLLMQIQAQNEQFSSTFNLEDFKASREKSFKQIQAAVAKYREIKENINEGMKFYVTLQDAITNVKQQCSDFVMTRSIQCREMIDSVQRQLSGFSFQNRNSGSNTYPPVGQTHPIPRTSSQQTNDGAMAQSSHPQTPYYQLPQQQQAPGSAPPPYNSSQQQSPSYAPAPAPSPSPYQAHQPQPPQGHDYGQAYHGWRGPYYNNAQQPGAFPRPPYTVPGPYPPPSNQGGYYKQQQ